MKNSELFYKACSQNNLNIALDILKVDGCLIPSKLSRQVSQLVFDHYNRNLSYINKTKVLKEIITLGKDHFKKEKVVTIVTKDSCLVRVGKDIFTAGIVKLSDNVNNIIVYETNSKRVRFQFTTEEAKVIIPSNLKI